jgi:hypothetical protein
MILINAAVAAIDGYGKMWMALSGSELSMSDNRHTLDAVTAEHATLSARPAQYTRREVRQISTQSLLHRIGHHTIDFLSVDAEGLDRSIIISLVRQGCRPELIFWECDKSKDDVEAITSFLTENRYQEVFRNSVNRGWASMRRA